MGELQTTERIGLPEVNAFAQPVVIVLAEVKLLVQQELFGYGFVAPVITKDEGCGKSMHELAIVFAGITLGGKNTGVDE